MSAVDVNNWWDGPWRCEKHGLIGDYTAAEYHRRWCQNDIVNTQGPRR